VGNGRDDEWGDPLALSRADAWSTARRDRSGNKLLGFRIVAADDVRRPRGGDRREASAAF